MTDKVTEMMMRVYVKLLWMCDQDEVVPMGQDDSAPVLVACLYHET